MLDADGPDRQISIADLDMQTVTSRQLVWADLVAPTQAELDDVAERLGLPVETVRWLALDDDQPRAALHRQYLRLKAIAVEPSPDGPIRKPLGIVLAPLPTDDVGVFWAIVGAIALFATVVLAVARRAAWL